MPNKKAIRNVEHKCSTPSDEIQPSIVADFNYAGVLSSVCVENLKGRIVGELIIAEG